MTDRPNADALGIKRPTADNELVATVYTVLGAFPDGLTAVALAERTGLGWQARVVVKALAAEGLTEPHAAVWRTTDRPVTAAAIARASTAARARIDQSVSVPAFGRDRRRATRAATGADLGRDQVTPIAKRPKK